MQIRTLFLVCTCALAGMAASLGCGVLAQALVQYQLAGRVEQAVKVSALFLAAADRLAIERPAEGDKLLTDQPADAASLAELAMVRQDTDRAMATVTRRIAALSYDGAATQIQIINDVQQQLGALRSKADAMIVLPKRLREPNLFGHYLAGFNGLLERLDAAQDLRDVVAAQQDGTTMDLIELAREVWFVRRMLGTRTVSVMTAMDAGVPLSPEQLEIQNRIDGIIAQGRASIESLLRRLSSVPGLDAAAAAAAAGITAHDRLLHEALADSRAGGHYRATAFALGRAAVAAGQGVLKLRDAALAAARTRVAQARRAALLRAAGVGAFVALILAATIAILGLLKRRIVAPLLALTEIIGRLAQRDYRVIIPPATNDEIGRMAGALETLRQGAIAAEQAEAQIAHLARHDTLTGLANRRWFQERLEQAIAATGRGETCALLCLDLDRFKAVNDTFGHPVGDLLLRSVAKRLHDCVREIDTVGRFGGDEFAVLLTKLDRSESAAVVADRVVRSLAEPFSLDGLVVSVGASVGIAVAPQDATSADALLKNADAALYSVKAEDTGNFRFFAPEMQTSLQARTALEQDMREAIRDESFEVFYQPQYALETSRISGFEALLRWRHPVRGIVDAADFVLIADESRLIVPLGAWVLRQACTDAMTWPDPAKVAVNLSPVQFRNRDLAASVREALAASGLPAARLELELTESALLGNNEGTLAVLHELAEIGIAITLDNFGTGHSSLGHLQLFAFDKIKIDRSFLRAPSLDARSLAIIRALVGVGRDLGMTITAVGVETEDQLDQMRRAGCTEVQGRLFSRPVASDQAQRLAAGPDHAILAARARVQAWSREAKTSPWRLSAETGLGTAAPGVRAPSS